MFGIPGEVFWPTAAIGTLILLVIGGLVLLRLVPRSRSGAGDLPERETLEDVQLRLGQLDQLQERVGQLEERLDFAERILAKGREGQALGLPQDQAADRLE